MNGDKQWRLLIKGRLLKINKWQAGVITEKVIQQLNAEPKVVISENDVSCALRSKSDRNVTDLSHVPNNRSTIQDSIVYHNKHTNNQRPSENRKHGETTINDIESELDKMFCLDNDPSTIKESSEVVVTSNKPRNKSRKVRQNHNDLLIKLFGSTLEDIVLEKQPSVKEHQPQKIQNRRHTLPVSINVPQEFLKPLKVSQKRNSANDVTSTVSKTQRIEESVPTVCELLQTEFVIAELLVKNETITQRLNTVVVTSDLEAAFIMEKPTTGVTETIQCGLVIDLTGEDSERYELVISTSSQEVKDEPSSSSERAQVPEQAPSMPLLSPVSPAQPTQREATLPETSGTAESVQKSQSWSTQRPPPGGQVMIVSRQPVLPGSEAGYQRFPLKRPYQEFQAPSSNSLLSVRLPPKRSNQDSIAEVRSHLSVPPSVAAASQLSIRPPTKHVSQDSIPPRSHQLPAPQASSVRPATALEAPSARTSPIAEPRSQLQAPSFPVEATPVSHSIFSNLRMLQADKTSQQAPNLRQSIEKSATTSTIPSQSSLRPSNVVTMQSTQQSHDQLLQATVSSILHTAQHQAVVPQPQQTTYGPRTFPQPPPYPGVQRQNSAPSQLQTNQAPPLIRMMRPTHSHYEFHLISNAACGEKLVPHVLTLARWKQSAIRFCEEVQTYLAPNDFRQDYASFCAYTNHSLVNFGKRLIRDLSTVEVDNFDLSEVCTVVVRRLQEQNRAATRFKVCIDIHKMIKSCEEFCLTPFTKKFFHSVQMCMAKMEEKSQKGQQVLFTVSQLKQLEWQIQRCLYFQKWLDCMIGPNRLSQTRPLHRASTKKPLKKANETNPLKQSLQNTMLRAMLQYQNAPDRSGRSCDNPTRPDLTPVSGDKTAVPSEQTPAVSSQERPQTHQVPVPVVPSQPAEIPANIRPSVSHETSVIVFSPAEEAAPVAAKTNQSSDSQDEDIIDLTWIDDGDESVMLEEITESKAFPCKMEDYPESDSGVSTREVVSPADSGLGSPRSQSDDCFKCLCGKQAIYVCACNSSMYCGRECQINDWADHQKWCQEKSS